MKKGRLVTPLRDKLIMLSLLSVAAFLLWYPHGGPPSEFDYFVLQVALIVFGVLILLLAFSQLVHYIWSSLNADGRE